MLSQDLKAQIGQATSARTEKSEAKAKALQSSADAKGDLQDTTTTRDDDSKYLADLTWFEYASLQLVPVAAVNERAARVAYAPVLKLRRRQRWRRRLGVPSRLLALRSAVARAAAQSVPAQSAPGCQRAAQQQHVQSN